MKRLWMLGGFLFCLTGLIVAEDPQMVVLVYSVVGTYTSSDTEEPVKVGTVLHKGTTLTRTSVKGSLRWIDGTCTVSPWMSQKSILVPELRPVDPAKQALLIAAIGGTLTRGKGASDQFENWVDLGTLREGDIDAGKVEVRLGPEPGAEATGVWFPLRQKIREPFQILKATYRVVESTLVRAEGELQAESSGEFFLNLQVIAHSPDDQLALVLTLTIKDRLTGKVSDFEQPMPYAVTADDGYLERKQAEVAAILGEGLPGSSQNEVSRLAWLAVFRDQNMNLYAQRLAAEQP